MHTHRRETGEGPHRTAPHHATPRWATPRHATTLTTSSMGREGGHAALIGGAAAADALIGAHPNTHRLKVFYNYKVSRT